MSIVDMGNVNLTWILSKPLRCKGEVLALQNTWAKDTGLKWAPVREFVRALLVLKRVIPRWYHLVFDVFVSPALS